MNEITWRAAEGLSLANFIPYLFVQRLSENTYKVLYLDSKGKSLLLCFKFYWNWQLSRDLATPLSDLTMKSFYQLIYL